MMRNREKDQNEKILIGRITSAVGLKGEVKVYNYSDGIGIYEDTPRLYVGDELMEVLGVRTQKHMVVLRLDGIADRNAAEKARGKEIFATEADLPDLPEGVYYVRDLIGMQVVTEPEHGAGAEHDDNAAGPEHGAPSGGTEPSQILGEVTDVIQNTAQDLFEVKMENGRKVLIPRVDAYVKDIDEERRVITVRLQEGLLDL